MNDNSMSYSIVQFSPRPERFEFVNVGVLVFDHRNARVISRLSNDFARVRKFFEDASPSFLKMALRDFAERVEYEFGKKSFEISADEFNSKRAGIFQITPVLPVAGKNPEKIAEGLFGVLVEAKTQHKRVQQISTRLTAAFREVGVLPLLQKRPKAVLIEKWGVNIKADYGYQNGVYNLIDAARFDDAERGLSEAGKRVLEGRALAETLEHRLVVVGDFGDQPETYVRNIKEELADAGARLFTLDEIHVLADEIRRTAH